MPPIPRYENNAFVMADFIYWVAKQEGNTYAATGNAITVPGTTDPNTGLIPGGITAKGKVYAPNPRIEPGFKVAVGMDFAYDQWDLFAEYTYLYSSAKSAVNSNNLNTGILPIFSYAPNNSILSQATYAVISGATGYVASATSNWNLLFDNLNVEMGKSIPLMCNFVLHPHFGFEAAWQWQHFNATYQVNSTTALTTNLGNNQIHFRQSFWGVGPRFGFDTTWQCVEHFGLFANSAAAALWGMFDATSTSYDTNNTAGYTNLLIASQEYNPSTLSPLIQIVLGAQTDWTFKEKYRFLVQAGWETQVWFFQNQHSTAIADTSLILQGFTLSFRTDF